MGILPFFLKIAIHLKTTTSIYELDAYKLGSSMSNWCSAECETRLFCVH